MAIRRFHSHEYKCQRCETYHAAENFAKPSDAVACWCGGKLKRTTVTEVFYEHESVELQAELNRRLSAYWSPGAVLRREKELAAKNARLEELRLEDEANRALEARLSAARAIRRYNVGLVDGSAYEPAVVDWHLMHSARWRERMLPEAVR